MPVVCDRPRRARARRSSSLPRAGLAAGQTAQRDAALERAIVERINSVRADHGLRPLAISAELRTAAFAHAAIATRGLFQHESADGSPFHQRVGPLLRPHGRLVVGRREPRLRQRAVRRLGRAVEAWLDSPPHRRNMLSPVWREIGVA